MTARIDRVGERVGDYTLERMLGRGGMSIVYFARDRSSGRSAAVKVLHTDLPDNIEAPRRLEQEARTIARIGHPNVVEVYSWGHTEDGLPFIVMEYLEGRPLSHLMARERPLSIPRTLGIVRQMLAALGRAHSLDIIHRDLKPDNVLLVTRDGVDDFVKMLDFGIAKLLTPSTNIHHRIETVQGVVLGTPEYLPPEIAMDLGVSPATDIYAIGVMMFEALTGRLPFIGRGAGELAEHHCFTPPPRPRAVNADIPPELERIVLRCMSKKPEERYQSAEELAGALRVFEERHDGVTQVTEPMEAGVAGLIRMAGDTEDEPDLHRVERTLRGEISRRWAERTLPTALAGTLAVLDRVRARAEELGTELALLEDAMADLSPLMVERERAVTDALAQEEALAAQLRELRARGHQDTELLLQLDGGASSLLGALVIGSDPTATDSLQTVLSAEYVEKIGAQLRNHEQVEEIERRRAALFTELADLTEGRASAMVRRAELEAELELARARQAGERLRLQARRDQLLAAMGAQKRRANRLLSQCALDLAVAVGLGWTQRP